MLGILPWFLFGVYILLGGGSHHVDESSSDCSVFESELGLSIRAAVLRS